MIWHQFSSWFKPYKVKVLSFLIGKFSLSLNFSFSVSVGVVITFRSCSVIKNLPYLLNVCSLLLKCLHASMAFGFFMYILWLFRLILNVSDFSTYWILHLIHSNKLITQLLWQVTWWKIVKVSLVWVLVNIIVLKTCWQQSDRLV